MKFLGVLLLSDGRTEQEMDLQIILSNDGVALVTFGKKKKKKKRFKHSRFSLIPMENL